MSFTQRGRIAGYSGHVPGLHDKIEVNTAEYSTFEFTQRSSPSNTESLSATQASTNQDIQNFHKYSGAATLSPSKFAPRSRIMGYQGHVPAMIQTYGIINSDFQNDEYLRRASIEYPEIDYRRPDTASKTRLVQEYRQRAQQVQQLESNAHTSANTGAGMNRPTTSNRGSRPSTHGSTRALSTPQSRPLTQQSQQARNSNPQDEDLAQQIPKHPGDAPYRVEDYLSYSRALSFSGYIPRKKFMVGL